MFPGSDQFFYPLLGPALTQPIRWEPVCELVAINIEDVPLSVRKGKVFVRVGKGEDSREIPLLDPATRHALIDWKKDRTRLPGADTPALFLNRCGGPAHHLSHRQLLDQLAYDADLVDEPGRPSHRRIPCGTNVRRSGMDVVVIAQLMGHRRLDTARLYALPNHTDLGGAGLRNPVLRRYRPVAGRTGQVSSGGGIQRGRCGTPGGCVALPGGAQRPLQRLRRSSTVLVRIDAA
ncbi:tyrosine-type recombinase/integrase [Nocardia gamkensis]|uniref:tyrosine-type recombinase/integrase n=1 Tax=Nocardia gamkensis TaxID=352869 RepID=UPI0036E969CE